MLGLRDIPPIERKSWETLTDEERLLRLAFEYKGSRRDADVSDELIAMAIRGELDGLGKAVVFFGLGSIPSHGLSRRFVKFVLLPTQSAVELISEGEVEEAARLLKQAAWTAKLLKDVPMNPAEEAAADTFIKRFNKDWKGFLEKYEEVKRKLQPTFEAVHLLETEELPAWLDPDLSPLITAPHDGGLGLAGVRKVSFTIHQLREFRDHVLENIRKHCLELYKSGVDLETCKAAAVIAAAEIADVLKERFRAEI